MGGDQEGEECGAEKLGKVDKKMGISWVEAMEGEVGGVGIVDEVVEGSDDFVGEAEEGLWWWW